MSSTTNDPQEEWKREPRTTPNISDADCERISDSVNRHQLAMEEAEQPKREPMLSNGEIQAMREVEYKMDGTDIAIIKRYAYLDGAMDARRWFRSKITSGELIRVKRLGEGGEVLRLCCRSCQEALVSFFDGDKCKCGSNIIE